MMFKGDIHRSPPVRKTVAGRCTFSEWRSCLGSGWALLSVFGKKMGYYEVVGMGGLKWVDLHCTPRKISMTMEILPFFNRNYILVFRGDKVFLH